MAVLDLSKRVLKKILTPSQIAALQRWRGRKAPLTRQQLQELADSVPIWWHSIDLGQGVVTCGHKSVAVLRAEVEAQRYPDLHGKSVLDIGAFDGFFSFEAERRGARRVVALDYYTWSTDATRYRAYWEECQQRRAAVKEPHEVPGLWRPDTLPGKKGFDTARRVLNSKVEVVVADFLEVDLDRLGTFDVVLFLGVLYHLKNPLLALQRLAAVTGELAVIETVMVAHAGLEHTAFCEFYEAAELEGDATNWWAPNRKALAGLCRAAGFRRVEILTAPPDLTTLPPNEMCRYRGVAHAWK